MKFEDFEDTVKLSREDSTARSAAAENNLRRTISGSFERAMRERGMNYRDLAREMGSSVSQVQRLLRCELGGMLTLRTLIRAADVLGLQIDFRVRPVALSSLDK